MSARELAALLGRMTKNDALLKEFCANPAKVLAREGIKIEASEVPAKIDPVEFSKRLKGAMSSGAVDLSPFEAGASPLTVGGKYIDIGYIDIDHIDTPIISILTGPGPDDPKQP